MNFKLMLTMLALLAVSSVGVAVASSSVYGDVPSSLSVGDSYDITVTPSVSTFVFSAAYDSELTEVNIHNDSVDAPINNLGTPIDNASSLVVVGASPSSSFTVTITPQKAGDTITLTVSGEGLDGDQVLTLETVYAGKSGGGTGSAAVTTLVNGTAPVPTAPSVPATEEPVETPTVTSEPADDNTSDAGSADAGSADAGAAGKSVPGLGLIGILGGLGAAAFMARRRNV